MRGFDFRGAGPFVNVETATAADGEDFEALQARHDEITARLERLELESELARMEREHEHRRNARAQHRELEGAIAETDEHREDLEHAAEQQEEDFQEHWDAMEQTYSSKRDEVEQRFESEIEQARGRFDIDLIEKRNSLGDDGALEAFDAQAELEWNQRERHFQQEKASVMAQMDEEYSEARRSVRADWRSVQENLRSELRATDRRRLSLEQNLEDLDEEGERELEISEMRARAEVLEETRALEAEQMRLERAMEQTEASADAEYDEEYEEDCSEADEAEDSDELVEETDEMDDASDWLESATEYMSDDSDASDRSYEIDELTEAVQQLQVDVEELRKEVKALWKAVRAREKKAPEVGQAEGAKNLPLDPLLAGTKQ